MKDNRYDQLIADLRSDYRPQREWGEGRGILMVIGHFLVGVAGGTWLMASIYGVIYGLMVAYVLAVLGALVHLMFLGRPERAIKMMRHVRTSWISRGFVGLSLFLIGGGIYLAITLLGLTGIWRALAVAANVVAGIGTIAIIGYMGFCYTASKAIPFWHSPLHPAIYIAFAIRGGIAALLVIGAASGQLASDWLLQMWTGVTALVTLFFALEIQGALSSGNIAAKWSVRDLLAGRLAFSFYGGTLLLGLIVPVLLLTNSASNSPVVMAILGVASVSGDFFMKLSTVKAGVYVPLFSPARRSHAG